MMKDNSQPLIVVKDVKKYYKGEVIKALDGINLTINEGEVVVIIGPSGSGKSTMLRCLNLLEIPTDGEIIFEGENLLGKKTNIDKHRQKMGMVFQHFNLFPHMTVMKNMTIAPTKLKIKNKEEAEAKAKELLEVVNLADRAEAYPKQLSGGQKDFTRFSTFIIESAITCLLFLSYTLISYNHLLTHNHSFSRYSVASS